MKPIMIALLLVCFVSDDAVAERYETSDGFALTLPPGWAEAPPEALRQAESEISAASQGAAAETYDYGYQLATAATWFEYPYVLVQVRRIGRVPEGQLAQYEKSDTDFQKGAKQVEKSFGDLVSNTQTGAPTLDEEHHVLWSALSMSVQEIGTIRALVAIKLTEYGIVQLMGYATEEGFEQFAPLFREVVNSMDVEEAHAYQPRLTDHAPTLWGINLRQTAIAGIVGALIAGAVSLARAWQKRRQSQSA